MTVTSYLYIGHVLGAMTFGYMSASNKKPWHCLFGAIAVSVAWPLAIALYTYFNWKE